MVGIDHDTRAALRADVAAIAAGTAFDPKTLRQVLASPRTEPLVRYLVEDLVEAARRTESRARGVVLAELCRAVEVQLRMETLDPPIMVFRHLRSLGVDLPALEAEAVRLERGHSEWHPAARVALLDALRTVIAEARAGVPSHLPPQLPLDVADALALIDRYGVSHAELELRPATRPAEPIDPLPQDLVTLYEQCGGVGRFIAPVDSLTGLQQRFLDELRAHVDDGDEEMDEAGALDVRSLSPFEPLLAIGTDHGGDIFFIDPRRKTRAGSVPVLRFVHDENCVVRPEAASLGAFVAALALRLWARRSGHESAWRKQRAVETSRAMPVAG